MAHHVGKRWLSFIARVVLSVRRSRTIATHSGFRGFLLVGSSCWEEVTPFHCKTCAFIRSKPHYCQTHWFLMFFVGWLIMLGRGGSLSLQELCIPYVEPALLPNTVVSDVFCGLAHHAGKRWLSFIARAVLSLGRSRASAKHTGFRGFLWVGSSCWEEVTLFHCKSCAFIRSKPRYCQTHWFQKFFVGWPIMLGRGGSLSFPHGILMVYHLIIFYSFSKGT